MQSQANRQEQLSYNPGFSYGEYLPRAPAPTTPGFSHGVTHYSNAPFNSQGTYRDPNQVLTGLRCGNNAYAGCLTGSTPGHEFNYTMAEFSGWGPPVPQLLPYNGYAMPNVQHQYPGQGQTNFAGYHPAAGQLPGHAVDFSPVLPGAYMAVNHEGASLVWRLNNCWISHAEQDEVHVTIALRRIPSA